MIERPALILLLVVNRDVLELFAFRSGSSHSGATAFAISRDHTSSRYGGLAVFLNRYFQCPVVHFGVRPRVSVRVASNWIIFPVKLARPLDAHGFTVRVDAVP